MKAVTTGDLPFLAFLSKGLVWLGFALMVLNLLQIRVISRSTRTIFAAASSSGVVSREHPSRFTSMAAAILITTILLLVQFSATAVFSLAVLRGIAGAP